MLTVVAADAGRPASPVAASVPSAAAPFIASRRDTVIIVRTRMSPDLSMISLPVLCYGTRLTAVDRRPLQASMAAPEPLSPKLRRRPRVPLRDRARLLPAAQRQGKGEAV